MASVLSHPAVPLAMAVALGPGKISTPLAVAGCLASVLPDIDALGFAAGIPYGDPLGHRGLTHSLAFVLVVGLAAMPFAARLSSSALATFLFVGFAAASHGVLDAMTTGGMGVAFFSPFSNARYFLPWRVIRVSPIGVIAFLSRRGLRVLESELLWIWTPAAGIGALGWALRHTLR